jgi:phenylacetate-coenzyme A ligase PaaK-like adenylate-forming protein
MCNPRQLRTLQDEKVRYLFQHLLPYHPFYRAFLKQEKVTPSSIASCQDLMRVPFIAKADLLPTPEKPQRGRDFILQPTESLMKKHAPKGQLLGLLGKKLLGRDTKQALLHEFKPIHLHFTTGRSAAQIPFAYTARDMDALDETAARIFEIAGGKEDDVIINAFPFAPHLAFWLVAAVARTVEVLSLHTGGGKILGSEKILNSIEQLKGTIVATMPGFGYHLLRQAVAQGRDFSHVRLLILGGERVTPEMRHKMKALLAQVGAPHAKVLATYALTEGKTAWVQCDEASGYHLYPDMEYIELVNEAGERVAEGEPGQIVYTSLGWRGSVVVRYKTGDFSQGMEWSSPCQYCGRMVPRLHPEIERGSEQVALDLTKIKGELVNLNALPGMMHSFDDVEEWQAEITKLNNDPHELDRFLLHVALKPGADEGSILAALSERVQNEMLIKPEIDAVPLPELIDRLGLEKELKEKRILDRRKEFIS